MTHPDLERLADRRLILRDVVSPSEIEHLVISGEQSLADAIRGKISVQSRFILAYDAAHSFALAALHREGYRSSSRYMVFQSLAHTMEVPQSAQRLLVTAHDRRNKGLYEGVFEISERFVEETIGAAREVRDALRRRLAED
jgi:hypothetical protein